MSKYVRSLIAIFLFSLPVFAKPSVQGIHNFYQVDQAVYRGGQPTEDGFKYLANLGVKVVLDLREADGRAAAEAKAVTALGMQYINVPMSGLTPPTEAEIAKILTLLEDSKSGGVFVHCRRGADRTGAVIAAYRIDHDHWDNRQALKEAMSDGMAFFQGPRQSFIRGFQARPAVDSVQTAQSTPAAPAGSAVAAAPAVPAAPAATAGPAPADAGNLQPIAVASAVLGSQP